MEVSRGDVLGIAEKINTEVRERHDGEITFMICPYCRGGDHRDRWTFSVNYKKGVFNCLRAKCGVEGSVAALARDMGYPLSDGYSTYQRKKALGEYRRLPQPKQEIVPKPPALRYLESRGIGEETVRKYQVTTANHDENILCFPIIKENMELVGAKYRNLAYIKGQTSGSKEWFEPRCEPYIYGAHTYDSDSDRFVLCEGQIDALSVYEAGIHNAFSVPNGKLGSTWIPPSYAFLKKFSEAIIFGDYENGEITLVDMIKGRFSGSIKVVRKADYKDCKDANEILQKYGPEQVRICVQNAEPLPSKMIKRLRDVDPEDPTKIERLKTGIYLLDKITYGGLAFGGVHIITGKSGEGKSTLAGQMIANAIEQNYRCFCYSGELDDCTFRSWMDYQIAGRHSTPYYNEQYKEVQGYMISKENRALIEDFYGDNIFLLSTEDVDSAQEMPDLCNLVQDAIMQYGCRVILLDNLMTGIGLMRGTIGSDTWEKQKGFVQHLVMIAKSFRVLIILVAHKKKNNFGGNELDDISGASEIGNLATTVISYGRPKDEDEADKGQNVRVVSIGKNRRAQGRLGSFKTYFSMQSNRIYGEGDNPNREFKCFAEPGETAGQKGAVPDGFTVLNDDADCIFD